MGATIVFGGVSANVYGGHITVCRGPRPSCAVLCVEPGASIPPTGNLVINDTDTSMSVQFNDCEVVKSFMSRHNESGKKYAHIVILDRRRKWGSIMRHGEINRRRPDGTVDPEYKKNLKEVVEGLLDAADESSGYTTGIPEDIYPHVKYRGSPMYAAEQALAVCGGTLVLRSDNQIGVAFKGSGSSMPGLTNALDPTHTQPRAIPSAVKVVCGDTWYQSRFEIEQVAIDYPSGEIVMADDVSYFPSGNDWPPLGYNYVDPPEARIFANHSVYKWFRVKELAEGGLSIAGSTITVNSIDQLLPLRERLAKLSTPGSGSSAGPAGELYMTVRGEFWPYTEGPENSGSCCVHPGPYTLMPDRGIIKFEYPVFLLDPDEGSDNRCVRYPILYLDIAHRVRDEDTGNYERKIFTRNIPGGTGSPVEIPVPWLFEASIQTYDSEDCTSPDSVDTNASSIEDEADKILDQWVAVFQANSIISRKYAGIWPMNLTGNIAQMEYRVGSGEASHTIISQAEETDQMEQPIEAKVRAAYAHQLQISGENWQPLPAGY